MKPLFIVSAILTAISALISVYLFNAPIERSFIPHWAGPLISFVSLIILIGAERGPKPTVTEKGFWAILIGQPLLGIIIQLHYLSVRYETLSFFDSQLVPNTCISCLFCLYWKLRNNSEKPNCRPANSLEYAQSALLAKKP